MRKGVEDISPDGVSKVRHALNVTEINNNLKISEERSPSKTTLYFHLDTLTDLGLIKVVATLHEGPHGRNKTKYYGRIARNLFTSSEDYMVESYTTQFEEFRKFAKEIDFKLPNNYLKIPKKISDVHLRYHRLFGEWLIRYEGLINEKQLDMSLLYDFLMTINSINSDYASLLVLLLNDILGLIPKTS